MHYVLEPSELSVLVVNANNDGIAPYAIKILCDFKVNLKIIIFSQDYSFEMVEITFNGEDRHQKLELLSRSNSFSGEKE